MTAPSTSGRHSQVLLHPLDDRHDKELPQAQDGKHDKELPQTQVGRHDMEQPQAQDGRHDKELSHAQESRHDQTLPQAQDHRSCPRLYQSASCSLIQIAEEFRSCSSQAWWTCLVFSTLVTAATRAYYISKPYTVIWDETHFGKMISLYMNRTYFFDVHPPGGKLMLTFFAVLSGYNGSFAFEKPGDSYEGYPQLVGIRLMCALLGTALAPLAFGCVWTMTRRLPAALLAALMVTAETGTLTLTKFILLDPPLMFFMMAAFLSMCRLHHATHRVGASSAPQWGWLSVTGLCLGCVVSVKFVGLFTVALVGLYTATQLWQIFAQSRMAHHLLARIATLIIIPILVYFGFFVIHDALLIYSNSPYFFQEATHSPGFQMRLLGNNLHNLSQPADVAFGNLVTLKNTGIGGGYLRSHNFTYPYDVIPGKKQQVTVAGVKDYNNWIQILFLEDNPDQENGLYSGPPEILEDGDVIRLFHIATSSLIGCGEHASPVSIKHNIVFSQSMVKDLNLSKFESWRPDSAFLWTVFKVEDDYDRRRTVTAAREQLTEDQTASEEAISWTSSSIKALTSQVQFQCLGKYGNCFLTWSQRKLPHTWGFGGEEVSCSRHKNDPLSHWIFEQNSNPELPNTTFDGLQLDLVNRFLESHKIMKFRNSRMKEVKHSRYTQRPWMWPIGYSVHTWYDNNFRVSLLGNPFIFAVNFVGLFTAAIIIICRSYVTKRSVPQGVVDDQLAYWCKWLLLAYLLHYLPIFGMDRVLYYHHYFPALQFSSLLTASQLGNHFCSFRSPVATAAATAAFIAALGYSFFLYCYVGYGTPTSGPYSPSNSTFRHLRLYEHWEI
ncbi:Glycosyl transferase family 39/83 [Trinorchestia longiramus]|nr:Glycosyl transferase family 39/83 [Trinorchestia longiramus]